MSWPKEEEVRRGERRRGMGEVIGVCVWEGILGFLWLCWGMRFKLMRMKFGLVMLFSTLFNFVKVDDFMRREI